MNENASAERYWDGVPCPDEAALAQVIAKLKEEGRSEARGLQWMLERGMIAEPMGVCVDPGDPMIDGDWTEEFAYCGYWWQIPIKDEKICEWHENSRSKYQATRTSKDIETFQSSMLAFARMVVMGLESGELT